MKEEDIRKRAVFNRYLKMVEKDVQDFFNDKSTFIKVCCPACEGLKHFVQFNKLGFDYVLCEDCNTLFVNPRPSFEALKNFYVQSPSTQFWINDFFKPVVEVRRQKIFRPRAEYVSQLIGHDSKYTIADIGAGFGLFLEELATLCNLVKLVAIEPSIEMSSICKSKGFHVLPYALENINGWDEQFDLLTSFELFEHIYDPYKYFKKARHLLREDGQLILTTLNGEGFDIQVLWEKSRSVFPPHHLNFFNPLSIKLLLERSGFIVEDISTPGKLDWNIVEEMIIRENIEIGRFWKLLTNKGNDCAKKEFQNWIEKHKLSSHMRVLARKR